MRLEGCTPPEEGKGEVQKNPPPGIPERSRGGRRDKGCPLSQKTGQFSPLPLGEGLGEREA